MRHIRWRLARNNTGRVRSMHVEVSTLYAAVYLDRAGAWRWDAVEMNYMVIDDDGGRRGERTHWQGGTQPTRRRAQRAARKALARMGLR